MSNMERWVGLADIALKTRTDRVALNCPKCEEPITSKQIAAALRAIPSKARAQASRENGKKGGRPKIRKELP